MIGRPTPDNADHAHRFPSYEQDLVKFVKIDAADGIALGIDQDGEIWVICGR